MAVTFFAMLSVVIQVFVPVHAPLQPEKTEPPVARAVSVTKVPQVKPVLQLELQLIPAGELVTFPVPPVTEAIVTFSGKVKLAPAVLFPSMIVLQVFVPVQAPAHPPKLPPLNGIAVRLTGVL